jgi:hypothetical protein
LLTPGLIAGFRLTFSQVPRAKMQKSNRGVLFFHVLVRTAVERERSVL